MYVCRLRCGLNLYTIRLTLANLGVEDMGIYGVVGSIVHSTTENGGMGNTTNDTIDSHILYTKIGKC